MIKAICFDLDGVLVDADKWHFNALNVALQYSDIDPISWPEHLTIYKGIPTKTKLKILSERKGLPEELWEKIASAKQEITIDFISKFCTPDSEKIEMMKLLKRKYRIAVCSNAKRETVGLMLHKSKLEPYVDFFIGNDEVSESKPSPQIYQKAFKRLNVAPEETVIVEDSTVGKQAAVASQGVLCSVAGPHEVNYYRVLNTINKAQRLNVVIPAAGQGKRFAEAEYQHPKPLIDVCGRPMIELVLSNFSHIGRPIILMQKADIDRYCANEIIQARYPASTFIAIERLTEGAACTALLAKELINNANELILANSDQFLEMDVMKFVSEMRARNVDGGMLTFSADSPKWSYAAVNAAGEVTEVAEKKVISNHATVGVYYYRSGAEFVKHAEQMIQKNIRVNNEFYICPVFNEYIADGKNIRIFEIDQNIMHGLGTPEDLQLYLSKKVNTQIVELDATLPCLDQIDIGSPTFSVTNKHSEITNL